MVICGVIFATSAWWRLPETLPPAGRVPFNPRNLAAMSLTVMRHREFLLLSLAAAVNFSSLACYIGSAPTIVEKHWHMGETSYWQLFLPVIGGILLGAVISNRVAGRMELAKQIWIGFGLTFAASAARVAMHLAIVDPPLRLQQALLFIAAIGAQIAFPVLTLRMLDIFPAARGTAASVQSFVAILMTAATFGVIAPFVLGRMSWIAFASLALTSLASVFWYLARRWKDAHAIPTAIA
jgi:DHA1 family bicyclomycin/chloramphenicol resistance-like MFS transporter